MQSGNRKNSSQRAALYFFETDLIEQFKTCYEDEISRDARFQERLLEFSSSDNNNTWQGSELFIRKAIETNEDYQFAALKDKLFHRFKEKLSELLKADLDPKNPENR